MQPIAKTNRLLKAIAVVLIVLLMFHSPSFVYLTFGVYYYTFFVVVVFIYILLRFNSPDFIKQVNKHRLYDIYFSLTIVYLFIYYIFSDASNPHRYITFAARLLMFYLIFDIVKSIGYKLVLKILFCVSIVLCFFATVLFFLNLLEFVPGSPISFVLNEDQPEGILYYYFPFGVSHEILPYKAAVYRSYSYFLEPAAFALLISCSLFYDHAPSKLIRLISLGALISTQSIAGLFAYFVIMLKARYSYVLLLVLSMLAFIVYLNTEIFSEFYDVRIHNIIARLYEQKYSYDALVNNPYGYGIGRCNAELVNYGIGSYDYCGPTNYFSVFYALGLQFFPIYCLFLIFVVRTLLAVKNRDEYIYHLLQYVLIMSFSYYFLDTAFFYILIATALDRNKRI